MIKNRGLSLTEILIVIVILALLAALLFPVFANSKERAKIAPCTTNLRQISVALSTYASDNNDVMPRSLAELEANQEGIRSALVCISDVTTGANKAETERTGNKHSYFFMPPDPRFRTALANADSNHGVAYCVLHGEREAVQGEYLPKRDTTGLVLRLRRDGSIQHAKVGHMCSAPSPGGQLRGRQEWSLLSDTKCVDQFCYGLTETCP